MWRFLHWAGRNGTLILPVGVVVGLAVQPVAELLRPLLAPVIFLMLVVIFIRLDVLAAVEHVRRPMVVAMALVLALGILPVFTGLAVDLFPLSPGLKAALILYTSSPPNFAAAALAFVLALDGALAVAFILGALVLHPIITPFFSELFTGGAVLISGYELALRLALLLGGAVVAAALARPLIGEARRRNAGLAFDGINMLLMLVFVIGLMKGIPGEIAARPGYAFALVALVFGLHLVLNGITALLFWRSGIRTAATVGYCSSGRNMAPAMAVLGSAAPADTWLFFAVLQFPIYLLPMLLKPIYRRLLTKEG